MHAKSILERLPLLCISLVLKLPAQLAEAAIACSGKTFRITRTTTESISQNSSSASLSQHQSAVCRKQTMKRTPSRGQRPIGKI